MEIQAIKIEVSRGNIKKHDFVTDMMISSLGTKKEVRKYIGLIAELLLEKINRSTH